MAVKEYYTVTQRAECILTRVPPYLSRAITASSLFSNDVVPDTWLLLPV
jgi:hypothetical protein